MPSDWLIVNMVTEMNNTIMEKLPFTKQKKTVLQLLLYNFF